MESRELRQFHETTIENEKNDEAPEEEEEQEVEVKCSKVFWSNRKVFWSRLSDVFARK